jgi:hypothetical protein
MKQADKTATCTLKSEVAMKSSILFLQAAIVLIGIGALTVMLWEPHVEGRNANATCVDIYFKDPFLVYAYVASVPFFVILYQAFKLLRYIGQGKAFSQEAVTAVRTIKRCAMLLVGFVAVGEFVILLNRNGEDDPVGGFFIGFLIAFGSMIIAAAATVLERVLQSGADIRYTSKQTTP